ncbi:MAG: hypothetical protein JXB05_22210 [Myxococcaceae bacterium]|nr:hypothetical protein [Myxococcaceae bacterium]
MNLCRLVVCLTLLAPSVGFAQSSEEWNPYIPPAAEATTPPPLVPAPTPPSVPAPPAPSRALAKEENTPSEPAVRPSGNLTALRLIATSGSGAVGGFVAIFAGIVPSAVVAIPFCASTDFEDEPPCAVSIATALSLSYSVGVTLGVTFTGKLLGGQGDGLVTFFGALAGAAVGGGIGVASENAAALTLGLTLGPLLFAAIGYEVSHSMATRPFEPGLEARAGFRVMPVVGTTPRGGVLGGLAGRF